MCVVRFSCPQLLDAPLRTSQRPVDRQGIGVGCYLGHDPGGQPHEGGRQRLAQAEYPLQAGDGDLHSLPESTPPLGWLRQQKDVHLGQGLLQPLASVGQVPQEPPRYSIVQSRLGEELLGQGDVGDVGRGEFVGEWDPIIGGADEVQLHPVDAARTPPHPRRPGEARALRDLPGVQNRKQSGVDEQSLRVADHLVEDVPPQGFQKTLELPRLSFLTLRCNEEGCSPTTTPGNRWEKNLWASRKNERSLSTPRSCWKRARAMTSESERRFMDS